MEGRTADTGDLLVGTYVKVDRQGIYIFQNLL